ncbi:MAG: helicase C-terminal domain-containing protein [Myxococcota bacterium]
MEYIDEVFGRSGHLSRGKDGYQPRNGQLILARAIDAAIVGGAHLLAEAPTGTGKSFAYLVPAIFHAVKNDKRVVVATANITLQEQLIQKDLPTLAKVLPWKFSFEQVKGKRNYLCLDKLSQHEGQLELGLDADEGQQANAIRAWCDRTATGDKSELPFEPAPRVWNRLAIMDEDECKGSECSLYRECFITRARARAKESHVVVTNQHLLMAHAHLGNDVILPPFQVAVLDEAHRAADTAREFYGFRLGEVSLDRAARVVSGLAGPAAGQPLLDKARVFFAQLRRYRDSDAYRARLKERDPVDWGPLDQSAGVAEQSVREKIDPKLWPDTLEPREAYRLMNEMDREERGHTASVRNAITRVRSIRHRLGAAMRLEGEGRVYFLESDEKDRVSVVCKPIEVAEQLKQGLFDRTPCVIATSATLAVDGGFAFARQQLGAGKARTLTVPSPFNWSRQALLVTPTDMPEPNSGEYKDAVGRALAEVVRQARGRTLALFTSAEGMHVAYRHVKDCGYRVLMQGKDGTRASLIEEFRRDVGSVLLGLESFWAGIDVPGESLSCVVIDRLPFLPPDDPVVDGWGGNPGDAFREYTLPRAVIAFKQGFGRLIRAPTDRGCVVLLDPRVNTKRYGRSFLRALPGIPRTTKLDDIRAFLG